MSKFMALCLALVFGFLGAIVLSYMPKELIADSQVIREIPDEVIPSTSSENTAVEVDGISFEILVPQQVWIIPPKEYDVKTPVILGLRITNNTQQPLRFTEFETISAEIIGENGYQSISRIGGREMGGRPKESDYLIAQPGQSVTFGMGASLIWVRSKLYLLIPDRFGGGSSIALDGIKPDIYKFRLFYSSISAIAQVYDLSTNQFKILENLWTGQVATQFVEIRLLQTCP